MIDFRYHLVSIVAVFLALTVGLVLGSTALRGTTASVLDTTTANLQQELGAYRSQNGQLRKQANADQSFAQAAEPQLIAHLLQGRRVVLVDAPGAPGQVVNGLVAVLREAGATVTGQVQLQPKFFDTSPATQQDLGQLAQRLAPTGMTLPGGTNQARASKVLASAILDSGGAAGAGGSARAGAAGILPGFAAGGYLTVSGKPGDRATLAVVTTPASPPKPHGSNAASQALVTLAQRLRQTGQGVVVAGSAAGSGPGSAIDVMRLGGRSGRLSTVDDANTTIGQIVVAQALFGQIHGSSGNYGITSSAAAPGPSPAPAPSPSSSPGGGSATEGASPPPSTTPRPSGSASGSTGKAKRP